MKIIREELIDNILKYIANSKSDFRNGEIFQLMNELQQLEDYKECEQCKYPKKEVFN